MTEPTVVLALILVPNTALHIVRTGSGGSGRGRVVASRLEPKRVKLRERSGLRAFMISTFRILI